MKNLFEKEFGHKKFVTFKSCGTALMGSINSGPGTARSFSARREQGGRHVREWAPR